MPGSPKPLARSPFQAIAAALISLYSARPSARKPLPVPTPALHCAPKKPDRAAPIISFHRLISANPGWLFDTTSTFFYPDCGEYGAARLLRAHRGVGQRASCDVEAARGTPCRGAAYAVARQGRGMRHIRDGIICIVAGGGPPRAWRDRAGGRIRAGLRMDPARCRDRSGAERAERRCADLSGLADQDDDALSDVRAAQSGPHPSRPTALCFRSGG